MADKTVKDIDKGFNKFVKQLKEVSELEVVAGYLNGSGNFDPETDIVSRAYVNERGSVKKNIPSRPFISTAYTNNQAKYKKMREAGLKKIISLKMTADYFLNLLGNEMVKDIKNSILTGNWKPNSKMTRTLKKSSRPLIDTSAMINSTNYEVRKAGTTGSMPKGVL
jgi:hypothetical protein